MSESLASGIHDKVVALSNEGTLFLASGLYAKALQNFKAAWELLPEPKTGWEAATWTQAAIGDVHWRTKNLQEAQLAFQMALKCPGGPGNPFIHLRLGQCAFELGDIPRAKDELTRAYMGAGKDIFREEPKYFEILKDTLAPPTGSESL